MRGNSFPPRPQGLDCPIKSGNDGKKQTQDFSFLGVGMGETLFAKKGPPIFNKVLVQRPLRKRAPARHALMNLDGSKAMRNVVPFSIWTPSVPLSCRSTRLITNCKPS